MSNQDNCHAYIYIQCHVNILILYIWQMDTDFQGSLLHQKWIHSWLHSMLTCLKCNLANNDRSWFFMIVHEILRNFPIVVHNISQQFMIHHDCFNYTISINPIYMDPDYNSPLIYWWGYCNLSIMTFHDLYHEMQWRQTSFNTGMYWWIIWILVILSKYLLHP